MIGLEQQFLAVATDRYGNRISDLTFTWTVETGDGAIDASGMFTAGTEPGTYDNAVRVTAAQGGGVPSASAGITLTAITAVSAGGSHACLVTSVGEVKCLGSNEYGQLGDGTTADRTTPMDVVGLTNGVAAVSAGSRHTCAVTMAGGVKCWGNGISGHLGGGRHATPVDVVGIVSEWWLEF